MPCRDASDNRIAISELIQEKTNLAQMLCEACAIIEKENYLLETSGQIQKWWKNHKKVDQARMKIIKEQEEKEKLKQKALSKLSSEEKKALGII